jgi:hypothetical protein
MNREKIPGDTRPGAGLVFAGRSQFRPPHFSAARGHDHNDVVLAAYTHSFSPRGEAESPDSIGVPAKPAMRGLAQ